MTTYAKLKAEGKTQQQIEAAAKNPPEQKATDQSKNTVDETKTNS